MATEHGQIWRYDRAVRRGSDLRLIVSANEINYNEDFSRVLALVVETSDPGGLLAVSVGEGVWVSALTVAPLMKSRLIELVDTCSPETMENVSVSLRAALRLTFED